MSEISNAILLSLVQRAPSTYYVQSGKFDKDYFNIRKKPRIGSLLIDNTSAVIIVNKKQEKRVLLPGFHFMKNGEQVLQVINLNSHHFNWRLNDQEYSPALYSSQSEQRQVLNHAVKSAQLSIKTKEGLSVIPTFSIHYNFSRSQSSDKIIEFLIELSNFFSETNTFGELDSHLKILIGSSITSIYKILAMQKETADFTSSPNAPISLVEEFIEKINIILNRKNKGNILESSNGQNARYPEAIYFLKNLQLLNIRVYLNTLSIENNESIK